MENLNKKLFIKVDSKSTIFYQKLERDFLLIVRDIARFKYKLMGFMVYF
jgi:hypothetical protein